MISDGKKVLVVDDEPVSQMLLECFFKSLGYEVTLAKNGEEALILFERSFFPYIVIDFNLPQMNGLSAVKAIRDIEAVRNSPSAFILGLTREKSIEQQQAALSAGINVFYTKPIAIDIIKDSLKKVSLLEV